MKASKGDRLIIKAHRIGEPERDAEILEARGKGGGLLTVFAGATTAARRCFPGPDAAIQHFDDGQDAAGEQGMAREQVLQVASADVMLGRDAIAARPRMPFNGLEGVEQVTLWQKGRNVAGLLWLAAGAQIPAHCHELAGPSGTFPRVEAAPGPGARSSPSTCRSSSSCAS